MAEKEMVSVIIDGTKVEVEKGTKMCIRDRGKGIFN